MYDLAGHRNMVSDPLRVEPYARAIAAVVREGDVVLDLGCGIGIMSVLAVRAGARRVFAVDLNDCVHYVRRVVEENGVADRVEIYRGNAKDVTLPERPTVIVADLRGKLPFGPNATVAWRAALGWLAPGGRIIPRRDVLFAQPIRSDTLARRVHEFGPVCGVSFSSLRGRLAQIREAEPADARALAPERGLFDIVYGTPLPTCFEGEAEFRLTDEPGPVDAFRVGFEADLAPGIALRSFGPGRAPAYGVLALPTLGRLDLRPGSRLRLRVRSEVVDGGASLSWAVDTDGREGPWQGAEIEQIESLDVLRAGTVGHVPGPDADDDIEAFALTEFGRGCSVGDTIERALAAFGGRLPVVRIERRVKELAQRRQARVVRRIGETA